MEPELVTVMPTGFQAEKIGHPTCAKARSNGCNSRRSHCESPPDILPLQCRSNMRISG